MVATLGGEPRYGGGSEKGDGSRGRGGEVVVEELTPQRRRLHRRRRRWWCWWSEAEATMGRSSPTGGDGDDGDWRERR